jgi:hypothetical protein
MDFFRVVSDAFVVLLAPVVSVAAIVIRVTEAAILVGVPFCA